MALFVLGFLLLWSLRSSQARMEAFDALERDIIFHNLDMEQAKLRIAEEYLGHEMGEWLSAKVESLKGTAADLITKSEQTAATISEVEGIDPTYATERKSRLTACLTGIESTVTSYDKEVTSLLKWLELAHGYNRYLNNPYYKRALQTAMSSISDTHDVVFKSAKESIRQLREATQKL
jgi:hypothetical protein